MRPSTLRLLAAKAAAAAPSSGPAAAATATATSVSEAAAAGAEAAAAVPWYRKRYHGAQAENMFQAAWGVSLALLFIGIPLVGTTVQNTMREERKKKMLEENSREREAFLRDLYGLDERGGKRVRVRAGAEEAAAIERKDE